MAMQEARHYGAPGVRREEGSLAGSIRRGAERVRASVESRTTGGDGSALARGLGWFSIGLGLAELVAPEQVARLIGVPNDGDNRAVLRALGLRELATGVGLLTEPRPTGLLWGRVTGDVMDMLLLGVAAGSEEARRPRLAMAAAAVAGVAALDVVGAQRSAQGPQGLAADMELLSRGDALSRGELSQPPMLTRPSSRNAVHVKKAITVYRPVDEVYAFWHAFENLPRFMRHLQAVEVTGPGRSHWTTKAPVGTTVEWDAEVVEDRANELIAWRSLPGADVDNWGVVRFVSTPRSEGTEVHVELVYKAPAGALGRAFAKLFGESPEQQVQEDLRAFKQVMETGEIIHSDASIHTRPHAAQPPAVRIELLGAAPQGGQP